MKQQQSSLSLAIQNGLRSVSKVTAKLASYLAAEPNRTIPQANRINTNPNAGWAQFQRVQMSWDGENIVKNSDFGANYVQKRRMYCTNGASYAPDTGDSKRDEDLRAYLDETWARMGINCSMMDAFSRTADVELPMRGDSGLYWYRDLNGLRLVEFQADRLGEIYQFYGFQEVIDGMTYFAGIYCQGVDMPTPGQHAAFKIYERNDQTYSNPRIFPASDVIFFKDDLMAGVRGVTKFAQALPIVGNRDGILWSTMQTMRQQSKIAAVASNNSGQPDELTYDTTTHDNGTVSYVERFGDGPVVRYQFNGDSYQVLRAEHPNESFQLAMDKLDMHAALAIGFPYEFLFSPERSGGAPSRFSFSIASKEIERLRTHVYRPRLNIISYVTIMDAIERGIFRPIPTLTRGNWNFGTLPSADAFRDVKSDLEENRAGTLTRNDITTASTGRPFSVVLRQSMQEAVSISKATQDANKQLVAEGYEGDIKQLDVAQSGQINGSINASTSEDIAKTALNGAQVSALVEIAAQIANGQLPLETGRAMAKAAFPEVEDATLNKIFSPLNSFEPKVIEPTQPEPQKAALAAYIGDVFVGDLPVETRKEIARILGTNGRTDTLRAIKYGMVASELERMADPHNLESAQNHLRYCTNRACEDEVHANQDKHILIQNSRIVDGHHFLAKALRGKVTKSLPVIDLTPTRFQISPTVSV